VRIKGHYRTFDSTHLLWKEALKGLDYDCYFHTWDTIDCTEPTWHSGEKSTIQLNEDRIKILQSFDKNVRIEHQHVTKDDYTDIGYTVPFISTINRVNALCKVLECIPKDKYDLVIVGRYDLSVKPNIFKNINVQEDKILIGFNNSLGYFQGISAGDLLFAFHPCKIESFKGIMDYYNERILRFGEEPFTKFIYEKFKNVERKWIYNECFFIKR
jgi:hypothetical protein